MIYTTQHTTDFTDAAFQQAFRTYFGELGCRVTNWDGLFAAMGETGREYTWTHRDDAGRVTRFISGINADERDHALTLRDETGEVVGFIQFTTIHMDSWFFTVKCGFIREFWLQSNLRRQAEEWLWEQGCSCVLLTTVTAPDFYRKNGYTQQNGIEARNTEPVFTKMLK